MQTAANTVETVVGWLFSAGWYFVSIQTIHTYIHTSICDSVSICVWYLNNLKFLLKEL